MGASGLGSFGLGVATFYLNFLYRALGFDDVRIGALVGSIAIGAVIGALPAALAAKRLSRRAAIIVGGSITGTGIVTILLFEAFPLLALAALLLGCGGVIVSSSGNALVADATAATDRPALFGQQIALGTTASFLASFLAGAVATPVAAALGLGPRDPQVIRLLIGAGGAIAAVSVIPILFVGAPRVRSGGHDAPQRRALFLRFLALEVCFGFGAGSFLPFVNLFFADRYGLSLTAIGAALGCIAVGGSLGALLHSRIAVPKLGQLRAIVLVELASLPFALVAAIVFDPVVAVVALAMRSFLMYGASATMTAFQQSSFAPAERAGAHAGFLIAWNAASAVAAYLSGVVRGSAGSSGYQINLLTLIAAYLVAALLTLFLLRSHQPRGDAIARAASDSAA
ncbi:MAG: MFS transporter [Chloroflexi bacterium]|nr:MFS transporter [Chloroflexota bacterium]